MSLFFSFYCLWLNSGTDTSTLQPIHHSFANCHRTGCLVLAINESWDRDIVQRCVSKYFPLLKRKNICERIVCCKCECFWSISVLIWLSELYQSVCRTGFIYTPIYSNNYAIEHWLRMTSELQCSGILPCVLRLSKQWHLSFRVNSDNNCIKKCMTSSITVWL